VDPLEGGIVKAIRTLIVDDEPLARETLRILLRANPEVDVVGECRSGPEAVDRILEVEPDLVFLDIEMPEMDGFDVLETVSGEGVRIPTIVFVTAYDQYALRAFEVHALDYLLKPFDDERFERALERAKLEVSRHQDAAMASRIEALLADHRAAAAGEESPVGEGREGPVERFVVRSSGRIHFVDVAEVDWVEAAGDYVRLHTGERSHLMRQTMKELEDSLDPDVFVRIHRSTIVRIGFVKEIRTTGTGQYVVLLEDGTRRNLSRSGRRRLEEVLGRAL
jgi:two-component system LytT family response regulator